MYIIETIMYINRKLKSESLKLTQATFKLYLIFLPYTPYILIHTIYLLNTFFYTSLGL